MTRVLSKSHQVPWCGSRISTSLVQSALAIANKSITETWTCPCCTLVPHDPLYCGPMLFFFFRDRSKSTHNTNWMLMSNFLSTLLDFFRAFFFDVILQFLAWGPFLWQLLHSTSFFNWDLLVDLYLWHFSLFINIFGSKKPQPSLYLWCFWILLRNLFV